MQELQIFNNPEFGQIRTTEIEGEPYFVGKDVAEALGYERTAESRIIDDFVSDWAGYTEEYPDWLNSWIEAALIGFGIGITIALVTITVCQSL